MDINILLGLQEFRNGALKVTVCAYRPWIRDARILPYGDSINTATGYSFPSGHTMNAATVFGGGAVRKDLPGMLRAALGFQGDCGTAFLLHYKFDISTACKGLDTRCILVTSIQWIYKTITIGRFQRGYHAHC